MGTAGNKTATGFAVAFALTAATIALWGFAHRLYVALLPLLGGALSLTSSQTDMARGAVALGYLLMTLPTAFISRNLGYKIGLLFGLGVFAIGIFLLYPAVAGHSQLFFLVAATVIGSGLAVTNVTAWPLAVFLGPKRTAIQRTTFIAALAPLGGLIAVVGGPHILTGTSVVAGNTHNLISLLSTLGIGAITLAFVIELANFPAVATRRISTSDRTLTTFRQAFALVRFRYAALAAFLCLFAQITLAGFALRYCMTVVPGMTKAQAHDMLIAGFIAFTAGRLVAPLVMYWIAPLRLLVLCSAASALCTAAGAFSHGPAVIGWLITGCFFLSVLFPIVFADAVRDLKNLAKSAAAVLMFIAYSGTGAVAVMLIACAPKIVHIVMIVPALCLALTTVVAWRLYGPETASSRTSHPNSAATPALPEACPETSV